MQVDLILMVYNNGESNNKYSTGGITNSAWASN